MTHEPDELERYLDDFAGRLRAATTQGGTTRPRRRRVVVAATFAVAGAGAAAVLLLGSGGGVGERLDIAAEARAALAPRGEIVHLVIRTEVPACRACSATLTEQWSAVHPLRWRFVQMTPRPARVGDGKQATRGRVETAYAGGTQRTLLAERNSLRVQQGYSDDSPAVRVPSTVIVGLDPAADLRAMLASGRVTDAGEHRVGGRTIRRLVSDEIQGSNARRRLVYDVDPKTFAPVQGSITLGQSAPLSVHFVVVRYEHLPITAASAKLLTITPSADTKVTVRTARDLRLQQSAMRAWRKRCVTKRNGVMTCPQPPGIISLPKRLPLKVLRAARTAP